MMRVPSGRRVASWAILPLSLFIAACSTAGTHGQPPSAGPSRTSAAGPTAAPGSPEPTLTPSPYPRPTRVAGKAAPTSHELRQIRLTPGLQRLAPSRLRVLERLRVPDSTGAIVEIVSVDGARGYFAPDALWRLVVFERRHIADHASVPVSFTQPAVVIPYDVKPEHGIYYFLVTRDQSLVSSVNQERSPMAAYGGAYKNHAQRMSVVVMSANTPSGGDNWHLAAADASATCEASLNITLDPSMIQQLQQAGGFDSGKLSVADRWGQLDICSSLGDAAAERLQEGRTYSQYFQQAESQLIRAMPTAPRLFVFGPQEYADLG